MADLLKIVRRGETCPAGVTVTGEADASLICDLEPDHPGPLHYDATDAIWWSTDRKDQ